MDPAPCSYLLILQGITPRKLTEGNGKVRNEDKRGVMKSHTVWRHVSSKLAKPVVKEEFEIVSLQRICTHSSVKTSQYRNYLRASNKEIWRKCKLGVIQICLWTWFLVVLFSFKVRQPLVGKVLLNTKASWSHSIKQTTLHGTPLDEWSASQRPLPDKTQHSQETDIHVPGRIRNRNASNRTAAGPLGSAIVGLYLINNYLLGVQAPL